MRGISTGKTLEQPGWFWFRIERAKIKRRLEFYFALGWFVIKMEPYRQEPSVQNTPYWANLKMFLRKTCRNLTFSSNQYSEITDLSDYINNEVLAWQTIVPLTIIIFFMSRSHGLLFYGLLFQAFEKKCRLILSDGILFVHLHRKWTLWLPYSVPQPAARLP